MSNDCVVQALSKVTGLTVSDLGGLCLWEPGVSKIDGTSVEQYIPGLLAKGIYLVPIWPEVCVVKNGLIETRCHHVLPTTGPGILCIPRHAIGVGADEIVPRHYDWEVYWYVCRRAP